MSDESLDDGLVEKTKQNYEFASFGIRVAAAIIDSLVFLPLSIVMYYNLLNWKYFPIVLLATIAQLIYKPYMEWKYQATLGKMAVKIKVVDYQLKPITFEQSIKRFTFYFVNYVAGLISMFLLFTAPGFEEVTTLENLTLFQNENENFVNTIATMVLLTSIMFIVFDVRKQALHDKLAQTFCIHKVNLK